MSLLKKYFFEIMDYYKINSYYFNFINSIEEYPNYNNLNFYENIYELHNKYYEKLKKHKYFKYLENDLNIYKKNFNFKLYNDVIDNTTLFQEINILNNKLKFFYLNFDYKIPYDKNNNKKLSFYERTKLIFENFDNYINNTKLDNNKKNLIKKIFKNLQEHIKINNINLELLKNVSYFDLIQLSSYDDNFIIDFFNFIKKTYKINDNKDIDNLINIYDNFTKNINDTKLILKFGILHNFTISKYDCNILIEELEKLLKNKKNYSFVYFSNKNNVKEYLVKNNLLEKTNNIIKKLINNIKEFILFIKNYYYHFCYDKKGIVNNNFGFLNDKTKKYEKEYYNYLIYNRFKSLKYNANNIHNIGFKELDKLKRKIILLKEKFNKTNLSNIEFINYIRNNPEYNYKNPNDAIEGYKKCVKLIEETIMKRYFFDNYKKTYDFDIKEVPESKKLTSPGAYYTLPSFELIKNKYYKTIKKGVFYLNTHKDNLKIYDTISLLIHETIPGHHLESVYAISHNSPKRFKLWKNYIDNNTPYSEGWALYAETLYDYDNLSKIGFLNYHLLRATRLIIDTGINYFGWSYSKCHKFMLNNTFNNKSQIDNELYRYISIPTQALSYFIGRNVFIKGLNTFKKTSKYIKSSNKDNDIKRYHHNILTKGPTHLGLLEFNIKNYIYNIKNNLPIY